MDNIEFLKKYQNAYESLKYFNIKNNYLILNYQNTYIIPLDNINLSLLNPVLYLLHPIEIYQVICLLTLLYKENLSENDEKFINNYVKNYLILNDAFLSNEPVDNNKVSAFSIPIYTSYDPKFVNSKASIIIANLIKEHTDNIENGKSKGSKLVRINPNFGSFEEEELDYSKAGFIPILLIVMVVIVVTILITIYILKH